MHVCANVVVFVFRRVYMRCVTWSRDSHGLFDYESRYINKKNIKTSTCGRIIRLDNDVELIGLDETPESVNSSAKPLITITQNERGKHSSYQLLVIKFQAARSISECSP